ncbi:hypothetical protein TPA0907_47030 [Micromonospora humidisoli]|nr:hypothetical protein TPA0907_47030 [Micromonospora sp. AKA109]
MSSPTYDSANCNDCAVGLPELATVAMGHLRAVVRGAGGRYEPRGEAPSAQPRVHPCRSGRRGGGYGTGPGGQELTPSGASVQSWTGCPLRRDRHPRSWPGAPGDDWEAPT